MRFPTLAGLDRTPDRNGAADRGATECGRKPRWILDIAAYTVGDPGSPAMDGGFAGVGAAGFVSAVLPDCSKGV